MFWLLSLNLIINVFCIYGMQLGLSFILLKEGGCNE